MMRIDEIRSRWHMVGADGFLVPTEGARRDLNWLVGEIDRLRRELVLAERMLTNGSVDGAILGIRVALLSEEERTENTHFVEVKP